MDLFQGIHPNFAISDEGIGVFETGEVQFCLGIIFGVAFRAVLVDEGFPEFLVVGSFFTFGWIFGEGVGTEDIEEGGEQSECGHRAKAHDVWMWGGGDG